MSTTNERTISKDQIDHLLRSRRSVFPDQFDKGRQIPDEVIWQILENANWAPNHKNTEPWRFRVFTGKGLKKFADFQASRYKENAGAKFREDKYAKLQTNPLNCSHILAVILKRSTHTDIPEMEEIAAVSCAVQNIYLSMAPYGLGGYWSTGGVTYDPSASAFLELGEQDRLMGFFYIGYPRIPSVGATRRPIADKTIWVNE